jgi:hypothetical protein
MADQSLGLGDRDRELKKWDKPYVFQEYPKMLYRFLPGPGGKLVREECGVEDRLQEGLRHGAGWRTTPGDAYDVAEQAEYDLGQAAAERAASDRRMSRQAQADAAAADAATARHLGEIPETPKPSPRKKVE